MNLHLLSSSVINSPFKGFTKRQKTRLARPATGLSQSRVFALVLFAAGCSHPNRIQTRVALIMTRLAGDELDTGCELDGFV